MIISRKNKGFTIIELLVVVSMIGLLSSVIVASVSPARAKARDAKRVAEVRQLDLAVNMYKADHDNAVPNLAKVSGGGCGYDKTNNFSNCIARSGDNASGSAWSEFMNEISPYMKTLPSSLNGIDYVYIAPAAMGVGADASSYQVSTRLESRDIMVGYTTSSNGLLSVPSYNASAIGSIDIKVNGVDGPYTVSSNNRKLYVTWAGNNLISCNVSTNDPQLSSSFVGSVNPIAGSVNINFADNYSSTFTLTINCVKSSGGQISDSAAVQVLPATETIDTTPIDGGVPVIEP